MPAGNPLSGTTGRCLLDCCPRIESPRYTVTPWASAFPRALANLYEDPEWSQKDLAGPTATLKTQVTKSKLGVLAPSQLQRFWQELAERARQGHPTCFTDLWALISEALLHDEVRGAVWPGHGLKVGSRPGQQGSGKASGTRKPQL